MQALIKNGFVKNSFTRKLFRLYNTGARQQFLQFYRSFQSKKYGLNLVGYFSYTLGVAEVGRFFAKNIAHSAIPFGINDVRAPYHNKLDEETLNEYQQHFSKQCSFYKSIFFINADRIAALKDRHPQLFVGRYNAGVFSWEFDDHFNFPKAFTVIDEVIVFTDFIATAVRKEAPENIKITKLNFPFIQNWKITRPATEVRQEWNIEQDEFVFLFNFDFHSVYERKNPEAILKAFESAFKQNDKVRLILKTIHAKNNCPNFQRLQSLIENMTIKGKVTLLTENMERNEFMNIMNASDSYISLHRSEGIGLGMMEAMSIGKPVIATRYGGNLDFMNRENSLLVDYNLTAVKDTTGPYQAGWMWADADVQQAATYMSQLYNDQNFAKQLGQKAKSSIAENYNPQIFIKQLSDWMKTAEEEPQKQLEGAYQF